MPKISIITPVYCDIPEKADWVIEAIDSVVAQTFEDWEMILIDDGSPINPSEAKYKYADDKRVRWFENAENSGPAKTRNTAVALADSECLLPLDADDLLPQETTLEDMYEYWLDDKTKIIYGNIEYYQPAPGGIFKRSPKIYALPQYNFDDKKTMLTGTMTISSMHSIQCWEAVGGWKPDFIWGLEDVEYWYAAGLAGYCGRKINMTTLVYRKHNEMIKPTSRTGRMKEAKQFQETQKLIIKMHSDALEKGVYPMSCCGGNKKTNPSPDPVAMTSQAQLANRRVVPLEGFEERDLEWVAYTGPKKGRFDILARGGDGLPNAYTIFGTGQVFQIHRKHHDIFAQRQRMGFQMNAQDPRALEAEEELEEPTITEAPRPERYKPTSSPALSTIQRLDGIAAQTREIEVQKQPARQLEEVIQEPNPPKFMSSVVAEPPNTLKQATLADLEMSDRITESLSEFDWTVPKLAKSDIDDLTEIQGIGTATAKRIIDKAKRLSHA